MGGGASGGRGKRNGDQDLVLDLSCRLSRAGAAPNNWHRTGALLHPGKPDKDLDEKAARKIHAYRELYRDHRRQLDFSSAIDSTTGRIYCELLRLLILHAHRETTRFFEILDDEHAQPHTSRFTYRRAAFFNTPKSKTGLMVARTAAVRRSARSEPTSTSTAARSRVPTKKRWRTSSKVCAPHLLHACAPHFHLPVT